MIYDYEDRKLEAEGHYFVAPSADVIGSVRLGLNASIWFGAVLRGDNDWIKVGNKTNIQEQVTIHVDEGFPVTIGDECILGHGAIVHGATLGNNVLVGMHATILNGAKIGNFCIIGSHALVTENAVIPDYSVVMGTPGKVVKQLTETQIENVKQNAMNYVNLSKEYIEHWK